jgi:O-antigen ligase
MLVSVPFLNPRHYYPLPTFYTEWIAFAIGLAALASIALVRTQRPLPVPGLCLGFFLLTAVLGLQVALGEVSYPLRSELGALYTIWAGLLVMLGAWLRQEMGEAAVSRSLQWWIAVSGVLVALSGFVQYYHIPLLTGTYQSTQAVNAMFGTINQRNHFADYLGCALVSVAFLYGRKALSLYLAALAALPLAAGMALSGSRAAWGYVATIFVVAFVLRRAGGADGSRKVLHFAVLAFAAFALVQLLNSFTGIFAGPEGTPDSSVQRLVQDLETDTGSSEHAIRIQLLRYAWLMFLDHPLLGVGFGQYAWFSFDLAGSLPGSFPSGIDRHSHNLFIQLLAETGIAGLLCISVPLASWFLRTPWRALSPERCWALGVLGVVGLHSMVEFPLWHANFLGLFALLLGVCSPVSIFLQPTPARRALLLMVVVAGSIAAVKIWADYRAFESWYLNLEAKTARGGKADRQDLESLMALRENSIFSPSFERIASEAIELNGNNLDDKLALNTQVMRSFPMPSVVSRQAALLALAGRDEEAKHVLVAATKIYPQATELWLPVLEQLARERPDQYGGLLSDVRARTNEALPDRQPIAPMPGTR